MPIKKTAQKGPLSNPILADLKRSGLSSADAKAMRVELFTGEQVRALTKKYDRTAYKIPYFDERGKPLEFFRLRFLDLVLDPKTGKTLRYWQPPQTSPQLYLPPGIDWQKVLRDKDTEIIITEGEKKAVCGCRYLKMPVIGLGGIWSWKSRPQHAPVIDGLLDFIKERKVTICFDADPAPNPDVAAARYHLSRAVVREGGGAYLMQLPQPPPGKKNGLDDVIQEEGAAFVRELERTPLVENRQLLDLNNELAIIQDAGAILHIPTGSMFDKPQRLTSVIYADRKLVAYDSKGNEVEKNLASEWLKWPQRRRYKSVVYEPGKPRDLPDGSINVWKGWGIEPKKGDVSPFVKLVDSHFTNASKDHKRWFLQWLAYPLQHPGTKLYSSVVLYSQLQGVGKSIVGYTMKYIYGENFRKINAADLHASFNDWAKNRQFILAEEVTGREKQEDLARLNDMITQDTVTVNQKFQVAYPIRDCINYFLTTNHHNAIRLDRFDRRFFIYELTEKRLEDKWFSTVYDPWMKSKEGAAALFDFFLRVDLSGFDPKGRAPATAVKEEIQETSDSHVDFVVHEMLNAPGRILPMAQRDLYMSHELCMMLDPHGKIHPVALANAFKRAGIPRLPATKIARGDVVRLYPIRNVEKWKQASHEDRRKHYDSFNDAPATPTITVGERGKKLNGRGMHR